MVCSVLHIFEPVLEAVFDVPHADKNEEGENGREDRYRVHAESYGNAKRSRKPQSGCRRYAMHGIAAKYDEPAAYESDARHDSSSYLHRLEIHDAKVGNVDVVAYDDKKARAERDKAEGARTRRLPCKNGALGAYHHSQERRKKKFGEHYGGRIKEFERGRHTKSIPCTTI